MRRPLRNTQNYREIKRTLNSLYLERNRLALEYDKPEFTKDDLKRLHDLAYIIPRYEYKFIIHLKSRKRI